MGHQQLGGDVGGVDEDVELVVAYVDEEGGVDADEVEVAGLGGFVEGIEDGEEGGVEVVVDGCVEDWAEGFGGDDGRVEEGGVDDGEVV